MGALRTIAITVLSISFVVFIALFGRLPAFRKTPIGWLHRALMVYLPNGLVALDRRLAGGRVTPGLQRFFDYLINDKHPIVMIFFIALQVGGEVLFIPPALQFMTMSPQYTILLPLLVVLPLLSLYYCYATSSDVTYANHSSAVAAYPYDYILYHPSQPCRTCHFSKPARSKHCSICKACVQKEDHHCIWINNCVGRNNQVYFMALLLSISLLLLYGSVLGYRILDSVLQKKFVPPELTRGSFSTKRWATKLDWWQYFDAWGVGIAMQPRIGATTLLCIMCCPLAAAFFVYHLYLLWAGMTTNESAKWADLKEDVLDGWVFKARVNEMEKEYKGITDERVNPGTKDWAKQVDWWIIRSRGGRTPTRKVVGGKEGEEEVDDRWRKVKSLTKDVDNVYDLGFYRNTKDMLFNRGQ